MEKGSCSIQETVRRLRNGFLTEEQFLDLFIRRINRVNPHVRALTESFPSATSDVRKNQPSLRIRAPGEQPLLGIPIVVNCDIPTRAGHTTTGSLALDFRPEKDARLVQRLADAGGVIVGKANITEWGNHRDREAGHGWSAMGGQTLGAHHVNQDPSGSSSGAAVAVALELCMAAIGVELCLLGISYLSYHELIVVRHLGESSYQLSEMALLASNQPKVSYRQI